MRILGFGQKNGPLGPTRATVFDRFASLSARGLHLDRSLRGHARTTAPPAKRGPTIAEQYGSSRAVTGARARLSGHSRVSRVSLSRRRPGADVGAGVDRLVRRRVRASVDASWHSGLEAALGAWGAPKIVSLLKHPTASRTCPTMSTARHTLRSVLASCSTQSPQALKQQVA